MSPNKGEILQWIEILHYIGENVVNAFSHLANMQEKRSFRVKIMARRWVCSF